MKHVHTSGHTLRILTEPSRDDCGHPELSRTGVAAAALARKMDIAMTFVAAVRLLAVLLLVTTAGASLLVVRAHAQTGQ